MPLLSVPSHTRLPWYPGQRGRHHDRPSPPHHRRQGDRRFVDCGGCPPSVPGVGHDTSNPVERRKGPPVSNPDTRLVPVTVYPHPFLSHFPRFSCCPSVLSPGRTEPQRQGRSTRLRTQVGPATPPLVDSGGEGGQETRREVSKETVTAPKNPGD